MHWGRIGIPAQIIANGSLLSIIVCQDMADPETDRKLHECFGGRLDGAGDSLTEGNKGYEAPKFIRGTHADICRWKAAADTLWALLEF